MRRSGRGGAPHALAALIVFFALATLSAAAAASAATTTFSTFSPLLLAKDDDGAAPSHSYSYDRGYVRFVVEKRGTRNNSKKNNKRRRGGGDKDEKRRLEFVRVAPSPSSSSSSSSWPPPPEAVAWCEYADSSLTPSGTGHLHVATSGHFDDLDQMRAAGFAEGFATAKRIADHLLNTRDYFVDPVRGLNASLEGGPLAWVEEQDEWLRAEVARRLQRKGGGEGGKGKEGRRSTGREFWTLDAAAAAADDDDDDGMPIEYWRAAAGTLEQLDGLAEGYRAAFEASSSGDGEEGDGTAPSSSSSSSPPPLPDLSYDDLRFLNANGELYDVLEHFKNKEEEGRGGAAKGKTQQLSGTGRVRAALSSSSFAGGGNELETEAQRGERLYRALALSGRCSSLVAVTPDLSDLLIGHATWDSFSQMTKIFKHFSFALNDVDSPSSFEGNGNGNGETPRVQQRLAMSSFPGELFSDDDFYLTPSLAVVSTTNHILNSSLFDWLPSKGRLLSWQRVRVALLLADDGETWARLFANRNSGTYNNQYDVVTLSRFSPGQELREGLLWVVEQVSGGKRNGKGGGGGGGGNAPPVVVGAAVVAFVVLTSPRFPLPFSPPSPSSETKPKQIPGMVVAQDQTSTLERGSWPAYTVPFFPEVQRASGISSLPLSSSSRSPPSPSSPLLSASEKAVKWLSYQLSPRAMLFRRDGTSLRSAADLRALMRSNTFKAKDPLSGGDPVAAICGRGDLEGDRSSSAGTSKRQASGCFDAKVTSWSRASRLDADAVAGPTTAGGTLPPFSWRDDPEFEKVPHRGLPEVFDFEYERFGPRLEARVKEGRRERVAAE